MIAQFDSDCRGCGERIAKGDRIFSVEGITHCEECGVPQGDERRGSATDMEDAPGYVRVLAKRLDVLEQTVERQGKELASIHEWARGLSVELGVKTPAVLEST